MVGHQGPLGSIGQSLTKAQEAAVIRRDQSISIGEAGGDRHTGCSRGGCQSGGDEFAAGEYCAHVRFFLAVIWPVIMAPTRFVKPARQTIATWTRTKSTRRSEAKK